MSIILKPHKCVQVKYFCIGQSMVIIEPASFSSIVAFADQAEHEIEWLDIFIENASMLTWEYKHMERWERMYVAFSINRRRLTLFLACMWIILVPVYSPSLHDPKASHKGCGLQDVNRYFDLKSSWHFDWSRCWLTLSSLLCSKVWWAMQGYIGMSSKSCVCSSIPWWCIAGI